MTLIKGNYTPKKVPKVADKEEKSKQLEFEEKVASSLSASIATVREGKLIEEGENKE